MEVSTCKLNQHKIYDPNSKGKNKHTRKFNFGDYKKRGANLMYASEKFQNVMFDSAKQRWLKSKTCYIQCFAGHALKKNCSNMHTWSDIIYFF